MISKKVSRKGNSSFARLAKYITDNKGIDNRVEEVRITNCVNDDFNWALKEIEITQAKNKRAKSDNTYHLVISFPNEDSEKLTPEILREAEDRLCESIGFKDHQRISAIHKDTDNIHIHVAINKINPLTFNIHEPYRDYKTRSKVCHDFEKEFNLKQNNHISKNRSNNEIENLTHIQSLESWIKKECLNDLVSAKSWEQLHDKLSENGLEIKKRGNGFVIGNGKTFLRASSVHRDLSKKNLEDKFGSFVDLKKNKKKPSKSYVQRPANYSEKSDVLFSKYKIEQERVRTARNLFFIEMKKKREAEILAAKKGASVRRSAIKIATKGLSRRIALSLVSSGLRDKIKSINKKHSNDRKGFFENNKKQSWADWLVKEANTDPVALEVLRYRQKISKSSFGISGKEKNQAEFKGVDYVTKQGTAVSDLGNIRDLGGKIELKEANEEQILKSLIVASERYGGKLKIDGNNKFKQQIVKISAKYQLDVVFEDKAMEKHRETLFEKTRVENERDKKQRINRQSVIRSVVNGIEFGNGFDRSAIGESAERRSGGLQPTVRTRVVSSGAAAGAGAGRAGAGRAGAGRAGAGRAGAGRAGELHSKFSPSGVRSPIPPYARNGLHSLSKLLMVHSTGGSKVLLQNDVPNNVVKKGEHEHSSVRWSGYGIAEEMAATKYILERENKRRNGFDISEHVLYNKDSIKIGESIVYQGVRSIDGVNLALIKRNDVVFVKPISNEERNKLRSIRLGSAIDLTGSHQIRARKSNTQVRGRK